MALLCIVLYLPTFSIGDAKVETALGKIQEEYYGANHNEIPSHHIKLDEEEEAFLDEVARIVPEGELILNMPDDGSVFAYATDGCAPIIAIIASMMAAAIQGPAHVRLKRAKARLFANMGPGHRRIRECVMLSKRLEHITCFSSTRAKPLGTNPSRHLMTEPSGRD